MSDPLFDKVSALDAGMANAYKKALGSKPDDPIGLAGAKAIFQEVIDGMKPKGKSAITTEEANALLLLLKYASFSQEAVDYFAQSLVAATKSKDMFLYEALFEGGAAELLKGDKLKTIAGMLDASLVGSLTFQSPGTKIPYTPYHYFAIKELIEDGSIEVYAMKDGGLTSTFLDLGGSYRSDFDRLLLFSPPSMIVLKVLIAHEVTHAIQDWLDTPIPGTAEIEADAYIAGATALKSMKMKPTSGGTYEVAHQKAAPIVLAGKATLDNPDWVKAYEAVKEAVGKDTGYGNYVSVPDKAGRVEKDLITDKIKKLAAAKK